MKDWTHVCPGVGCKYPGCENQVDPPGRGIHLTLAMVKALTNAARAGLLNPWEFGSGTISGLKKRGLVEPVKVDGRTMYRATQAGRRTLLAHAPVEFGP